MGCSVNGLRALGFKGWAPAVRSRTECRGRYRERAVRRFGLCRPCMEDTRMQACFRPSNMYMVRHVHGARHAHAFRAFPPGFPLTCVPHCYPDTSDSNTGNRLRQPMLQTLTCQQMVPKRHSQVSRGARAPTRAPLAPRRRRAAAARARARVTPAACRRPRPGPSRARAGSSAAPRPPRCCHRRPWPSAARPPACWSSGPPPSWVTPGCPGARSARVAADCRVCANDSHIVRLRRAGHLCCDNLRRFRRQPARDPQGHGQAPCVCWPTRITNALDGQSQAPCLHGARGGRAPRG